MKLLSWNIRRASGSSGTAVVAVITAHAPDVALLVDPPRRRAWHELTDHLARAGYDRVHAAGEAGEARVAIAARCDIGASIPSAPDLELRDRWAEVVLPEYGLRIAGVYVPVTGRDYERKQRMWHDVIAAARARSSERFVITGDWNSGDHPMDKTHPGRPFRFVDEYRALLAAGWTEAWRCMNPDSAEFTWYRHDQRGFRIDHAFVSPALSPFLRACSYSHDERIAGTSDHSILLLDLDVQPAGRRP